MPFYVCYPLRRWEMTALDHLEHWRKREDLTDPPYHHLLRLLKKQSQVITSVFTLYGPQVSSHGYFHDWFIFRKLLVPFRSTWFGGEKISTKMNTVKPLYNISFLQRSKCLVPAKFQVSLSTTFNLSCPKEDFNLSVTFRTEICSFQSKLRVKVS